MLYVRDMLWGAQDQHSGLDSQIPKAPWPAMHHNQRDKYKHLLARGFTLVGLHRNLSFPGARAEAAGHGAYLVDVGR